MKKLRRSFVMAGLLTTLAHAPTLLAGIVDFESVSVPRGTTYGVQAANSPGQVVLSQNGIDMSVENFVLGPFTGFFQAEVGGKFDFAFPTTPLSLDNISVSFDFSNVGFNVGRVTLDYREFGGSNNFAVNGQAIRQLAPLTSLPTNVAPGVTAIVDDTDLIKTITLEGTISSFLIGGQELAIDNVEAVPEPSTLVLLGGLATSAWLRRRPHRSV